jgi:hypothetical protein
VEPRCGASKKAVKYDISISIFARSLVVDREWARALISGPIMIVGWSCMSLMSGMEDRDIEVRRCLIRGNRGFDWLRVAPQASAL